MGNDTQNYTFSSFICGSSNSFAHAAAHTVVNADGVYTPLLIIGKESVGKTHLLLCIKKLAEDIMAKVVLVTAEEFMSDLLYNLRRNRMPMFRSRYRDLDMLLLDDVQLLSGKVGTQEELLCTFDALYHSCKRIVVTSDRLPKEIDMSDHLRSRLQCGLSVKLEPPDFETKLAYLDRQADQFKIQLGREVSCILASQPHSNFRTLSGWVMTLQLYSTSSKTPITEELAARIVTNCIL